MILKTVKFGLLINLLVDGVNNIDGSLNHPDNLHHCNHHGQQADQLRGGIRLTEVTVTPNETQRRQKQSFQVKDYLAGQGSG